LYSFFDKRLAVQHIGMPKHPNVEAPAQTLTDTDAMLSGLISDAQKLASPSTDSSITSYREQGCRSARNLLCIYIRHHDEIGSNPELRQVCPSSLNLTNQIMRWK